MSTCGNDRRPGCGKEIDWGVLADGTKVPLDRGAPIYRLGPWDPEARCYSIERVDGYRVSHFKTCPKANEFSKKAAAPGVSRRSGRDAAAGD